MRVVKITASAVICLLLSLLIISLFLPSAWSVERSIVINTDADIIFPYIDNLRRWPQWTVWYENSENLVVTYEGPEEGIGATSRWKDKNHEGLMKIVESRPNELIAYDLLFDKGTSRMHGSIALNSTIETTEIVWTATGDAGINPISKYFALMLNSWIGRDFERSLAKLKAILENPTPKRTA